MQLTELIRGIPPTERLYFRDSYSTSFNAKLVAAAKEQGKSYYVVLDRTLFHPKGGGQPTDTGSIRAGGFSAIVKKVMDVQGVVVHYVKLENGTEMQMGETVNGSIDWEPRYKYMKRHTSAHMFDHCINAATGRIYRTLSSWLGEPLAYVDYSGSPPTEKELSLAEELANNYVDRGFEVNISFVRKEDLVELSGAPNIERLPESDTYRVVQINGFESIPCGGTHLKNTKEIGRFRIHSQTHIDGGFRVKFDAG